MKDYLIREQRAMNDEEIKEADDVIEETIEKSIKKAYADQEDDPQPEKKPELNAARIHQFGTYRLFYDVRVVDEEQKIWKGRPVPEADHAKIPQARDMEKSWVLFTRVYKPVGADANEWDRVYPEYEIKDAKLFGQRILIVPKEKILFAYNPPPRDGILLPGPGLIGRG